VAEALAVIGAVGAGKTTVGYAIGDRLAAAGTPHAVIDLDAIRQSWPAPPDDPFNNRIELGNLAAMWRNYAAAGAERLVLMGVIESRASRARYRATLGLDLTVCRLTAPVPTLQRRVAEREGDASRAWHVARAAELTRILDEAGVDDYTVDNDGVSPEAVAETVLRGAGWLDEG
jgi:predicted kinase